MRNVRESLLVAVVAAFAMTGCGDGASYNAGDAGTDTDTDTDADSDAGPPPDCSDVWTDPASGLSWPLLPSGDGTMAWQAAADYCDALTLCEHGDWRLPTIGELRTLVRGCDQTVTGGACGVTDTCTTSDCTSNDCDGCAFDEGPDEGCYRPAEIEGSCAAAWSSTDLGDGATAWEVGFRAAGVVDAPKSQQDAGARCIHGGQ